MMEIKEAMWTTGCCHQTLIQGHSPLPLLIWFRKWNWIWIRTWIWIRSWVWHEFWVNFNDRMSFFYSFRLLALFKQCHFKSVIIHFLSSQSCYDLHFCNPFSLVWDYSHMIEAYVVVLTTIGKWNSCCSHCNCIYLLFDWGFG